MGCGQSKVAEKSGDKNKGGNKKESDSTKNHREPHLTSVGPAEPAMNAQATKSVVTKTNPNADPFDEGTAGLATFTFGSGNLERKSSSTREFDDEPVVPAGGGVAVKPRRAGVSDEVMEEDEDWTPPVYEKTREDLEKISSALAANPLFQALDHNEKDAIVAAMKVQSFSAGTAVLTEGTEGTQCFYVICSGSVDINKKGEKITTFKQGQAFGELELMYPQPCVATVMPVSDITCGVLDRATYKRLIMKVSVARRELFMGLLGGLEFLSTMSEYEKTILADALQYKYYQPGDVIIPAGKAAEWMHIIVEGTVEVLGREDGEIVCTFDAGKCIGELEFVNGHDNLANCVAKTKVKTASLHRQHFEMCLGSILDVFRQNTKSDTYAYYNSHMKDFTFGSECAAPQTPTKTTPPSDSLPPAAAARRNRGFAVSANADGNDDETHANWTAPVFKKSPAETEVLRKAMGRNPLFTAMTSDDRAIILDAMEPVTYSKGTEIMSQGEVGGEHWYIIADGRVEIEKQPFGVVATFGKSEGFGELELLYNTRTAATVRVVTDALTCFRLDRTTYQRIVMTVTQQRRQTYKDLLGEIEFLKSLSEYQQTVLADALAPETIPAGTEIIAQGTEVEWMYIIVEGTADVIGNGEHVCELGRGEMIGELEFLHKHSAAAQVVAKTELKTCKLHRDHFELTMGPLAGFIEATASSEKYQYYRSKLEASK
eukprot:PhM_4_TR10799/c0_g1_i1/m.48934/K04739/PRKAR; cAMP-dependent protein kinase regulator